jgi:hypothetical protein
MKTILWVAGMILFSSFSARGQFFNSSHVPQAAKLVFHQQYPKARHTEWTKDEVGYQARFELHRKVLFVIYDTQGNSLAEVVEINKAKLPRRAKKQLHENYPSFSVQNSIMIKSPDGKVIYGTHVSRAEESYDLVFNLSGYIVSVVPAEVADGNELSEVD